MFVQGRLNKTDFYLYLQAIDVVITLQKPKRTLVEVKENLSIV